jgi:hypothetical protein
VLLEEEFEMNPRTAILTMGEEERIAEGRIDKDRDTALWTCMVDVRVFVYR